MTDIIPSQNPADDANQASMLRFVLRKYALGIEGMLPATVVSYDRDSNRATIQPAIQRVTTAAVALGRAPLASIPVLALGGGGFTITFPLQPGDTGWIEASDRDISLWLQSGGVRPVMPNTQRIHSFSDGRFIPDTLGKHTLPGAASGAACIQSLDGSTYITIANGRIDLVAADGVFINGIRMDTHVHSGVQSGGSNTAGPQS